MNVLSSLKLSIVALSMLTLAACSSNPIARIDTTQSLNQHVGDLFLRGVFNWWEASNTFQFQNIGNDKLSVTVELIADGQPYDFKVADSKWTPFLNCGQAQNQGTLELDKAVLLVCQENSLNLQFMPSVTGRFTFILDVSSPGFPELEVIQHN